MRRGGDDAAECLCRTRTEIVHSEAVHCELLLEVDEADARSCNDVAFFNVDLGTWSEEKKSRSAALIDRERCSTKSNTRAVVGQTVARRRGQVQVANNKQTLKKNTWDESNPDIDHARHGSCSSGGYEAQSRSYIQRRWPALTMCTV